MGDIAQTFTLNQDGTITINLDGKSTRFAKESDLLAVKGASETALKEYESSQSKYQTDLAEANRVKDETRQELLKERAAKEQMEKDSLEAATLRTKVGELETESASQKEARGKLEEELTGIKRIVLTKDYKVDEAKVKDMNLDQLRETEKIFGVVGFSPKPAQAANYDGGPGAPGGAGTPLTPIEQAKQEIVIARKIQADKRAGKVIDQDYQP